MLNWSKKMIQSSLWARQEKPSFTALERHGMGVAIGGAIDGSDGAAAVESGGEAASEAKNFDQSKDI